MLFRVLLWTVFSTLVLAVGFLGYVYLAGTVAASRLESESVRSMQTALTIYARIILVKGLVPQVVVSCLLFAGVESWARGRVDSFGRKLAAFGAVSLVPGVLIAAFLLTADLTDLPAVKYTGALNFVLTAVQMTAAVTAAAMATRWVMDRFSK